MRDTKKNTKLTKENFKQGIYQLDVLFRYNLTEEEAKIYWEQVNNKEMTNELFDYVCKQIIHNEHRFPTIATFDKYRREAPESLFMHYRGFWRDVDDCAKSIQYPSRGMEMPPKKCSGEILEEALKQVQEYFDNNPTAKEAATAFVKSQGYEPLWK